MDAASRGVQQIFGSGKYKVRGKTFAPGTGPPMFSGGGSCVVSHREYLSDIYSGPVTSGSSDFSIARYDLNPGLVHTFPWLSTVAANYEEYDLMGCVFEFKSTCGDAFSSSNNSLGTVVMATEYNAGFPTFTSKIQMENYQGANSSKPSRSCYHAVECAKGQNVLNNLYVRSGEVPDGQSEQLYDGGAFQIATQGMQAANINLGELWVTYKCKFRKPKFNADGGGDTALWHLNGIRPTVVGDTSNNRTFGVSTNPPRVAAGSDLAVRWSGADSVPLDINMIFLPRKPVATRYVFTYNMQYNSSNGTATDYTGTVYLELTVSNTNGTYEVTELYAPATFYPSVSQPSTCVSNPVPQNTSTYNLTAAATGYPSLQWTGVFDVDAWTPSHDNRVKMRVIVSDQPGFTASFPTTNAWVGNFLITTVPSNLTQSTAYLGTPSGSIKETGSCEDKKSTGIIPPSLRKGLKGSSELGEGKEEKRSETDEGDDDQDDDINAVRPYVPSLLTRFNDRRPGLRHTDFDDDEDDQPEMEPEPLREEKKDPPKLTSLSSMPPPPPPPIPPKPSQSSSDSTPPPGAVVLTPRTIKKGWF